MGFKHVGKKVELGEFRFDKGVFLEKSKSSSGGKMSFALVDVDGKIISGSAAISAVVLADDNAAIPQGFFEAGILTFAGSSDRTKATPSKEDLATALKFTDFYQFGEFIVINTSSNIITIGPGSGVTITGAAGVAANTSATFRVIADSSGLASDIYRIA